MTLHRHRGPLYDVVAVRLDTSTVRVLATGKTRENAEAIERMAVARRGMEEEFFATVLAGEYVDGDMWDGGSV